MHVRVTLHYSSQSIMNHNSVMHSVLVLLSGINANDGFGGGDEIGHNLVFSSCRESGDHGPFNVRIFAPRIV